MSSAGSAFATPRAVVNWRVAGLALAAAGLLLAACTPTTREPASQAPQVAAVAPAAPPAASPATPVVASPPPVPPAQPPLTERQALTNAAAATRGARRLVGAELRSALSGNTLVRETPQLRTAIAIAPDGRQAIILSPTNGQVATDRGQIRFASDRACSRWERIFQGRELCYAYFRTGDEVIAVDLSGFLAPVRYRIQPGLPGA